MRELSAKLKIFFPGLVIFWGFLTFSPPADLNPGSFNFLPKANNAVANELAGGPRVPVFQKKTNLHVQDFANILDSPTQNEIEALLAGLEKETTHQVVVVTVPDLDGYPIEEYALALGRSWGVGQKDFNNGVVFLLAPREREVRIEVGYGLEGALPDILAGKILNEKVIPLLKQNNFPEALRAGALAIAGTIRGEKVLADKKDSNFFSALIKKNGGDLLFFALIFLWGFLSFLSQTKSWWLGGVFGGIVGILFIGFWGMIFCALGGLIIDFILSKYFYGKIFFPRGGGGFGGSGTGSFGGGGFGGGSFGGGGASGRF